ncbi:hypothetical protein QJS66_09685 [Kocuria rhizophila]|nr:hypothetical protein QJS66_09685 [Kocuria rhizophila]
MKLTRPDDRRATPGGVPRQRQGLHARGRRVLRTPLRRDRGGGGRLVTRAGRADGLPSGDRLDSRGASSWPARSRTTWCCCSPCAGALPRADGQ